MGYKFLVMCAYVIIFFLGFLFLGYQHELVHVTIFEDYGIDSHVEYYGNGWDWVTKAEGNYSNCNTNNGCVQSHNMNEVIGYQLMPIYLLIGFVGAFLLSGVFIISDVMVLIYEELASWRENL